MSKVATYIFKESGCKDLSAIGKGSESTFF